MFMVADYYKDVISQLKEKQQKNEGETTHPKVVALVREISRARSRIDPNDSDLKVGGVLGVNNSILIQGATNPGLNRSL